jgi:dipeptidyl aminopeptidase/acylaminoacyl peptidase
LLTSPHLGAAPKSTADLLFSTRWFRGLELAPDGRHVAWVEDRPNADRTPTENSALYVRDMEGGQPRRISAGDGTVLAAERDPAWSPDGRQLAFLSDAAQKQQRQLYLVPASGGRPRCLTHLKGYVAHVKWSPDGGTIAVLNIADSTAAAGAVEAEVQKSGEVGEHAFEERLLLVDAATGVTRAVTPADTYVYEFDWAPDSRRIAIISAKGNGDNNWWVARLQVVDAASGEMRELFKPSTQIAVPRWAPDGRSVALIQGLMSDAGSTGGEIWLVPADGGAPRNLTPGRGSSPAWLAWESRTGGLLFSESADGGSAVCELDVGTGRVTPLWAGDAKFDCGLGTEMLSISLARDGKTSAVVLSSFDQPPEIWAGPLGKWAPLTSLNGGLRRSWGRSEKIKWKSEGFEVQGWLMYPGTFEQGRRYPLIVSIHGGPAAQAIAGWPGPGSFAAVLAAEGYFVFVANPRGSYGQGEAFTAANKRDFGYGDFRDIMAGLDQVERTVPIDESRVGVTGWSYGGYLTMWAVTQTGRFRAAVSGAGVANLLSYYGENQIDEWMIPYFGASAYDDPAGYARCSPITFIKNAHTPTLILAGDSDKECPAPQSYEFWHALRTLGVEARLVVYANEGHHFNNPADAQDLLDRTVDWFGTHLR